MSIRPPYSELREPNGFILVDTVPMPSGLQPGDTNGNPDLGRRRPESLSRHFPNSPTGLIESGRVSVNFWKFMKTKIEDMSVKAPDLNDLKLGGGTEAPGLDHPLMPNLGAVVVDPDGPQTPTGMQTSFHNDAGDTATPGEAAGVNPSRNPSITTAARADTPFILGRLERYS